MGPMIYAGKVPSTLFELFLNLSGFAPFAGKTFDEYLIQTSWFIGTIMSLYLFYPYISKAMKKHPNSSIIVLFITLTSQVFRVYINA